LHFCFLGCRFFKMPPQLEFLLSLSLSLFFSLSKHSTQALVYSTEFNHFSSSFLWFFFFFFSLSMICTRERGMSGSPLGGD
jgi:hypothetical protein